MELTQNAQVRQEISDLRPQKLRKRPEFVQVPRAILKRRDLATRDALAYGLVVYRDKIGGRIGACEIAQVFGWVRTTGWRALVRLRELGLLDADDAPIPGAVPDDGGFLRVRVDDVRELGGIEAITLVQLQTFAQLRMAKVVGRHVVVTARGLASLVGCCAETASSLLQRLATGVTNRVRRAQRGGKAVVARARVELLRAIGRAPRVRILGEREAQAAAKPEPRRSPSQPPAYCPTAEELAALRALATARHR